MRLEIISVCVLLCLSSCSSHEVLINRKGDNRNVLAKKEYFSGIEYMSIKVKYGDKKKEIHLIDCKIENGIHNYFLTSYKSKDVYTHWQAVTDTTKNVSYFDRMNFSNLKTPYNFRGISSWEKSLIEESLNTCDCQYFDDSKYSVSDILGFIERENSSIVH